MPGHKSAAQPWPRVEAAPAAVGQGRFRGAGVLPSCMLTAWSDGAPWRSFCYFIGPWRVGCRKNSFPSQATGTTRNCLLLSFFLLPHLVCAYNSVPYNGLDDLPWPGVRSAMLVISCATVFEFMCLQPTLQCKRRWHYCASPKK